MERQEEGSPMNSSFIKPRYDQQGFASLPGKVADLLSSPGACDAVVLILLDGFGWRFFEKFQSAPFLKCIVRAGRVEKIISQFPSTTAAHLTTLHTGLPVGEHGVFEWYFYEPSLDALISPLLFSFAGTPERDTLRPAGVRPRQLFPFPSLYRQLKKRGVTSTIFQHREYTPSSYGEVIFAGASAQGYKTLPEALVNLADALPAKHPPAYYVLYYDRVDALSHQYGPGSPQVEAEILAVLQTLESGIFNGPMAGSQKVKFFFTADHGQAEVDPRTTLFLNRTPGFEGLEQYLRSDRQGRKLIPAGSARDLFLYIQPGCLEQAQAFLSSRLEGKAEVHKVSDLMAEGYFGPSHSARFCERAGDLVILPYLHESVWWYEKNKYDQKYFGHHGGLTPQEMEIPLLAWEL